MATRRQFIIASILLPATAMTGYVLYKSGRSEYQHLDQLLNRVKPTLRKTLGQYYAQETPDENEMWLTTYFNESLFLNQSSTEAPENRLELQINQDFEINNTVGVLGWQLSKDEARFLALAFWAFDA